MRTPYPQLPDTYSSDDSQKAGTAEAGSPRLAGADRTDESPRLVIRGESFNTPHPQTGFSTTTDWVDFIFSLEDSEFEINYLFK